MFFVGVVGTASGVAHAQSATPITSKQPPKLPSTTSVAKTAVANKPRTTSVEIRLLVGNDGAALHSQQWLKVFEKLDVSLQIQKPEPADKPEVRERIVGTLRYVTAIGVLSRDGKISFSTRTFSLTDGARLNEWIDELRTYGAQGSPEGQELWGLSKEQFERLFDSLNRELSVELKAMSAKDAVTQLSLPDEFPVRWSQSALDRLRQKELSVAIRQELKGFSVGTAMAIGLNDVGFGYRPNRTPAGGVEIVIEPQGTRNDLWPIGWPLQQPRLVAAPGLFSMSVIELPESDLGSVLTVVSKKAKIPVLVDHFQLDLHEIDLSQITVSLGQMKNSWAVALNRVVVPQKLTREIWQDEAGKTFVWITTTRSGERKARNRDAIRQD